ncbi:hypothetical protein E3N88_01961 [Mikania micrantha]|uniref:Protein kinase domain-containing protein n=1 Tax=Mikania micrantha TaxID=192012 RepID=A0A5N6Q2I0_9ASTR|nr:hypothetical protein E3N88_01961 [Mikania micrantha]
MILVFFFVSLFLSCLPVHFAAYTNISRPNCPESFYCPGLTPFKYPFFNVTDSRCGLIKVNCTSKGGEIQLGGRSYEITGKLDPHNTWSDTLLIIHNATLQELVNNKSCEALMNDLTNVSLHPLLYSISIGTFITLFKCTNNLFSSQQTTDAYFDPHDYKRYNTCNDYIFYYNYLNGTVPSDLPHTCQIVRLPTILPNTPGLNETNIFSLISYYPSILFNLSSTCYDCYKKGLRCDIKNESAHCSDVIKEIQDTEPTPSSSKQEKHGWTWLKIFGVIVGSVIILMLPLVIFIIWHRRCKRSPFSYYNSSMNKSPKHEDTNILPCGVTFFSYEELEDATQNFDPSHELGDGGFGAVFYGKLQDGREVAVKKLHEHNYKRVQQFFNEVEILTRLRHRNLVVLYGFTYRQNHELLLVYEYVPNRTVADHLHGVQANPTLLTWPIRLNIAIETARALVYLHASEIIHRDVKTSNILLDHSFCVKVADFGLSRLIPSNVTHVSTTPQGTPGYVDPEYHQRYQLTDKSDVYSFGVVLIELISSMVAVDLNRSQDEISLANLALNRIQGRAIHQLIDPVLGSDTNPETMNMITSVAEVAFRCLQYHSEMRPTMSEVLDELMNIQATGGVYVAYDSIRDLQTVNDAVVLLKDFRSSPVSVTGEWQSNNTESTTISSNGDELSMKNDINI